MSSALDKIDPALINMAMEQAHYDQDVNVTINTNKDDVV